MRLKQNNGVFCVLAGFFIVAFVWAVIGYCGEKCCRDGHLAYWLLKVMRVSTASRIGWRFSIVVLWSVIGQWKCALVTSM
jgi:hypothetical protein